MMKIKYNHRVNITIIIIIINMKKWTCISLRNKGDVEQKKKKKIKLN